ncbi:hypothetical protein M9435_000203 [Picochlorum sp. BPE23]|nr:hypothetical protein M9435_000203 [Picochlorum sp. BPE23]
MATLEFFNRTIIQCHRSNKVSLGRRRGGKGVVLQTTKLRAVGHRNVDDEVVSVIQPECKDSCEVQGEGEKHGLAMYGLAPLLVAVSCPLAAHSADLSLGATIIPGIVGDSPFREGLVSAFLLIFFSEIGDKTFFIALLLALQRPKGVVFTGTFGALAIMTVISVGLGRVLHGIDDLFPDVGFPIDDALAVALLVFFGVQTLANAAEADETAEEEKEEAKEVVEGMSQEYQVISLVISTFALVFAAEWGDKSFLATIALAAASDPLGVIAGAVTGHGVATVIAVLGGSFLGKYLSEKTVQYVGGSLFLVFAAATLLDIVRGV